VLVGERGPCVDGFVGAQRVALVDRLAEQLPRPEVDQFREVHRPVDVGGFEDRPEHVVHRHVAVEVDDQPLEIVARADVGPHVHDEVGPARWFATLVG